MSKKRRMPKMRDPYATILAERTGNFRGAHKDKRQRGSKKHAAKQIIEQELEDYYDELDDYDFA